MQRRPHFHLIQLPKSTNSRCSNPSSSIFAPTTTNTGIIRYATISNTRPIDRTAPNKEDVPPPHPFHDPFPFPTHPKPTPHQIFHLRPGASQQEIKQRYYDLVRTHHPDSSHPLSPNNNSAADAHSRFRAIKAAYDFLRGCTVSPDPNAPAPPSPRHFDPYMHEMARRRRAWEASKGGGGSGERSGWAEGFGAPKRERGEWDENGRKERLILLFGVLALVGGLFPTLPMSILSIIFPTSVLPSSIFPFSLFSSPPSPPSPPSQSNSSLRTPSIFPFSLDFGKTHRAAAALSEARREARDIGMERREEVRKRVKDMGKENENENGEEGAAQEKQ